MVFIYVLIILFVLLLIYQFYSYDIIEGIDQAEIDKINSKLTELIGQVRNITDGTIMKQLKSDVDTSKSNIGSLNSEFQFYRDNKDNINEMILASSVLFNAKNDAIKNLEFDGGVNVEQAQNQQDQMALKSSDNMQKSINKIFR